MSKRGLTRNGSFRDTLKTDNDLTYSQLSAVKTIQRLARQKKALKTALAEHQWKIFADFDTRDEAEMLHLAVFMQSLLDNVPDADGNKPGGMDNALWENSTNNVSSNIDDSEEVIIQADSRSLEIAELADCVHGDCRDYDMEKLI